MSSRIAFEDFIRTGLYLRNWSKRTVRTYRQAWGSFSSFQQSRSPQVECMNSMPTKADLEAWVIWLREKGVTPGGVNMYVRTMNSFCSWLYENNYTEQHLKLRLLPCNRDFLKTFSDSEIKLILNYRPKGFYELRTWTLILTLLDTGVRIEEALTLRTSDLNFDELRFKVVGKGNKVRIVPFSLELRKKLFKYEVVKSKRGMNDVYVFSSKHNRLLYRNSYRDIIGVCKKAGVCGAQVHPHAFRHYFAISYIRNGGDIYSLSRILGHTSISTTQIYLRAMSVEQISKLHNSFSPLSQMRQTGIDI